MDGGGLSVGGVASIGVAAGTGLNIAMAPASQATVAVSIGGAPSPGATDFVVSISDAAMRALSRDAASLNDASTPSSRLADDLAALALLALLEREQRQNDPLAVAATAIAAYLAVQAMNNG